MRGQSLVRWQYRDYCVLRCAGAFLSTYVAQRCGVRLKSSLKAVSRGLLVCYSPLARDTLLKFTDWPRAYSTRRMGKKSRRQRPGPASSRPTQEEEALGVPPGYRGLFIGAAERNTIFRNRGSGFAAAAVRRDTAMNRASAHTGPRTSARAGKNSSRKAGSAGRKANRWKKFDRNTTSGIPHPSYGVTLSPV